MNDDFFNQGIEKFSGQFCGIGVLLDESDPLFGIQGSLLLCGQLRLQAADLFLQLQLFCLVLFRQQIEVILGDASGGPVLLHSDKLSIHFCLALFRPFQFGFLTLGGGHAFPVTVFQNLLQEFFFA